MELSAAVLVLLLVTGFVAGLIDTIAGGGGLLTVPALLATGLSPAQAIATNKLQSIFGTASAAYSFVRSGEVDWRGVRSVAVCTLLGAALGAAAVQILDPALLFRLVPWLLLGATLYFVFSSRLGDFDTRQRLPLRVFAVAFGLLLGFYDGFFGPGTGAFWVLALVGLLGQNLRRATAHAKVLNLASNIASLALFLWGGSIVWAAGFAMGAGQVLGARVGASLVISRGTKLVRPLLITVSVLITLKVLSQGS